MSLRICRCITTCTIVKLNVILGTLGKILRTVDPELSIPVLRNRRFRVNLDTTATIDTYAIFNNRSNGTATSLLRIEAALSTRLNSDMGHVNTIMCFWQDAFFIRTFHIAINNKVNPTNLL